VQLALTVGVIGDNLINIGRALTRMAKTIVPAPD
jgi:hypothetical protein